MKQAADPNPSAETSPMRIVTSSSSMPSEVPTKLADVSVIEASDYVWSCPCTHDCVLTTTNVIERAPKRQLPCCNWQRRLQSRHYSRARDHQRRYSAAPLILSEERGIANGVVTESGRR